MATLAAGSTLHILAEHCRKDISELTKYFNHHQITHAFIPFQLFTQISSPLPFMKLVLLAGEKITNIVPQSYKIMICYAMSETTAFTTYFTLDKAYEITPIGKPAEDMAVYLLDESGNLCDEGEICIAGPLAQGYWNLSELTAKAFVYNPFATGEHDKVLLHTGDIAKRLPDGNLLYLNRNDWMVKISGQRVEPGEIEVVMQQLPEVEQAVVKAFVNARGLIYLCGFYTVNSSVSENAIRSHLAKKLPDYMQPRFFVQLDDFPLNFNGKLDRLSLQAPKAAEFQVEYVAPETPEEALICRAFETVLDLKPIGVLDDFFRIGGDSLGVMSLMAEAERLHLKSEHIFNGKTPRGIAALVQKDQTSQIDLYADCQEARTFYPLTSAQRIVLSAYLLAPLNTVFNVPFIYTFPLAADAERIQNALLTVFAHYSVLKVKLVEKDGIYGMTERPDAKLDIPIIDVTEDEFVQKKQNLIKPFNPKEDLLIRAMLYRTEKHIYLFWDAYHIIMDGTSVTLFFDQFIRAYYGKALLPEQLTQFHLSNYEQKYLQSELFGKSKSFFDRKLAGHIFRSEPAFDHPEYADSVRENNNVFRSISDPKVLDKLEQFLCTHDITVATFFASCFAYTLRKMTANKEVYFLSVENGRHDPRLQHTLGQLIQHIPITVSFEKETSVIAHMQKLQTDFRESLPYDCYPFEQLENDYGVSKSIMNIYQGESLGGFDLSDNFIPIEILESKSNILNILVCVFKSSDNYKLFVRYNARAYEKNTIDTLMNTYVQTIHRFLL